MFKIHFINHSGLIISYNKIRIAFDPWIEGSVFNNSWDLLVKTPESSIKNLIKSNYVWFSHEHPDHFNPRNLNIFNNNTNFIFQKTKDKRVVNFLKKKISNKIIELDEKKFFKLSDGFTIKVIPFQYLDSMCLINIGGIKILNLNDCDIKNNKELENILNICGNIDLLLVQFSYAIGKTNNSEKKLRQELSLKILSNLSRTIKFLKPKITIPFASFCFFSKEDNFYLNDSINTIYDTINYLQKLHPDVKFNCFYPGDEWSFNDHWNNKKSFEKYKIAYENIKPKTIQTISYDYDQLKNISKEFINLTLKNNNLFRFYKFINKKKYKLCFYVTDWNKSFSFDFDRGLVEITDIFESFPVCKLSSDSLNQLFSSGYGYDALIIGGRFETNKLGMQNLNNIFKFQAKNYQNYFYNFNDILIRLLKKIFKQNNAFHKR